MVNSESLLVDGCWLVVPLKWFSDVGLLPINQERFLNG